MTTIYIADPNLRQEQVEALHQALPAGWQIVDTPSHAHAILTEHAAVTAEMINAAGAALRLVARLETGAAPVAATDVPVIDLPNTALTGVAEMSVLFIMALSRHLLQLTRQTRAQAWLPERSTPILTDQKRYTYNWTGLEDFGTIYGKTAGLIGLGVIGRATAVRLRALGMRLLYTQRNRMDPASEAKYGVQWRSLDDLLAESDFVSLHHRFQEGPDGNDKHIGARELALMKPTAYLINTARGRLVDEDALIEALRSGQIAGAGLDVFEYEPLRPDSPLWELAGDNVILTPHVAGAPIVEAWQTVARDLVEHLAAQLAAKPV
jgi:phosphoglycerate dehydrogenase-like enzyme